MIENISIEGLELAIRYTSLSFEVNRKKEIKNLTYAIIAYRKDLCFSFCYKKKEGSRCCKHIIITLLLNISLQCIYRIYLFSLKLILNLEIRRLSISKVG